MTQAQKPHSGPFLAADGETWVLKSDYDGLKEQLEAAEKALAFYGDPETYFAIGFLPDRPCGEFEDDFEELDGALGHPGGGSWVKPGKRARAYFKDAYPASDSGPSLREQYGTLERHLDELARAAEKFWHEVEHNEFVHFGEFERAIDRARRAQASSPASEPCDGSLSCKATEHLHGCFAEARDV